MNGVNHIMSDSDHTLPPALAELLEQFDGLPRQDRIDLLLDFAASLPPVPDRLRGSAAAQPVHECLTPVTIYVEADGESAAIWVEVGETAPTIAAVAAVILEGCAGAPRTVIGRLPSDLPLRIIGPEMVGQRRLGLMALVNHLTRAVRRLDDPS